MNYFELILSATIIFIITLVGGIVCGFGMREEAILDEIEQYNSIRIEGVYYYPERSGANDK